MPTRACVGSDASAAPSNSMLPSRYGRMPMIVRISVVFPAPLRPISPANCPEPISMLTLRAIPSGPIDPWTRLMRSMRLLPDHVAADFLGGEHRGRRAVRDHPAIVERHDAARVARNDVHIVLDEQHADARAANRAHHEVHD